MKHKVTISVADQLGRKTKVLKGAEMKLPTRLLNFLFGGFTQVYLLAPGQTVKSVDIEEINEGGQSECQK